MITKTTSSRGLTGHELVISVILVVVATTERGPRHGALKG